MLPRDPKQRVRGGFTLIELLVVVAIIALLISILLPSLSRAKAQTRQVVCKTHLMSLAKISRLYAADNKDFLPRGIQGFGGQKHPEYTIFATALLPYLSDYTGDPTKLFAGGGQPQYVYGTKRRKWVIQMLRDVPEYQCPDFPDEKSTEIDNDSGRWTPEWKTCPFDYTVSAFSFPYLQDAIDGDTGGLTWVPGGGDIQGENIPFAYKGATKLEDFPLGVSPSDLIYLTEVHDQMGWDPRGAHPRFFTVWLTSHLPFAGNPRVANDQRHPGGINAMFFDSHSETMELHQMDPGAPHTYDRRLRWFTIMGDDYTSTGTG